MKYKRLPVNTFKELQLNAGVFATKFDPTTGVLMEEGLFGATTGGASFTATPTFSDLGEDIDNCPKNTKELAQLDSWDVKASGTMLTQNTTTARRILAAADIDPADETKIVPRTYLIDEDFADLWWIGDYSDKNGAENGGFIAIHLINALSTGGFSLQSSDKAKGQMAFEFTAFTSLANQDVVPFELYIKAGEDEPAD